jgi:hypothetical protein
LETVQQTLFHPRVTFEHMANPGSISRPLLFAVAMAMLVFLSGWGTFRLSQLMDFTNSTGWSFVGGGYSVFSILTFSWYFGILFIGSGFAYLTLKLLAPKKVGFERIFRVFAYVLGSTLVLVLVPIFGPLLRNVWLVFSLVVALKAGCRVKLWHAIAAYVGAVGGYWLLFHQLLA